MTQGRPSADRFGPSLEEDEEDQEDQEDLDLPLEYVSIHGHVVGLRRGGSGPALLFLHGIAGSLSWVPVMKLLQSDFTVLAPDLVGHGRSRETRGRLLARQPGQLDA